MFCLNSLTKHARQLLGLMLAAAALFSLAVNPARSSSRPHSSDVVQHIGVANKLVQPQPPTLRANGKIVFGSNRDGNGEIYVMDADGGNQRQLTNSPAGDDNFGPAWSPDGTKIVFTSRRHGDDSTEIYVMNADGSNQTRLTNNSVSDFSPDWSPDGTKIVFVREVGSSLNDIFVMNADGSGQQNLGVEGFSPAWSPDGTKIAFVVEDGYEVSNIYVMGADGGGVTQLTGAQIFDYNLSPAWSPDGMKIAFSRDHYNIFTGIETFSLCMMNPDGSNQQPLIFINSFSSNLSWSPDGTKITFDLDTGGNNDIFVVNSNGGGMTNLSNHPAYDYDPAWGPLPLTAPPSSLQFTAVSFNTAESNERTLITVTRFGDTSAGATVDYATIDHQAAVRCDDNTTQPGAAFARCDYATTVDTLHFAPGETQASFSVPLIDDAHAEGNEAVQLILSNPTGGASLGAPSTATLTITDTDAAGAPNPIDSAPFFVRMQYLDFLSREPETGGFQAWLNVLNNCPDPNSDPTCDRIMVSSSFFRSQEFQLKGYFVHRFYKVSLGRLPGYAEIIPDMRRVTGQSSNEVFAKRADFTNAWVQRAEFQTLYPSSLTAAEYVDKLLQTAGVRLTGTVTRETLIDDLQTGRKTRAEVLRAVVEHPDVDAREFNGAFVAMQYFGYLRRDPEANGYDAWLRYLNANPSDFRTMVHGFVNSIEYRLRFGPVP